MQNPKQTLSETYLVFCSKDPRQSHMFGHKHPGPLQTTAAVSPLGRLTSFLFRSHNKLRLPVSRYAPREECALRCANKI